MKTFIYKAKDGPDKVVEGKISSLTKQDAVDILNNRGYTVTYLIEESEDTSRSVFLRRVFGVNLRTVAAFSRDLSNLLKSGIPMLRSLSIIAEQTDKRYFRNVINRIYELVKDGQPLSSALREYPRVFSDFFVAFVKAGENSGSLDKSLFRISSYYGKQLEFLSKLKAAIIYPSLIVFVGFFTIVFLFVKIIPSMVSLLSDLNIEAVPLPTRILLSLSDFAQDYWHLGFLALFIFALIIKKAYGGDVFKNYASALKLRLPVIGAFILKSELSKFARAVETSLHNGIPVIRAIEISSPIVDNHLIRKELEESRKDLESGASWGDSLRKRNIFPPFVYNLISIGEESGDIGVYLSNIADSFEADCEEKIKMVTNIIEPLLILIIGIIVAFIVSAVLMPVFELSFVQF